MKAWKKLIVSFEVLLLRWLCSSGCFFDRENKQAKPMRNGFPLRGGPRRLMNLSKTRSPTGRLAVRCGRVVGRSSKIPISRSSSSDVKQRYL